MMKQKDYNTAAKHNHNKARGKSKTAAVFCLAVCLSLLVITVINTSFLGDKNASAKMESSLRNFGAEGGDEASGAKNDPEAKRIAELEGRIDPCWLPLIERLKADGMYGPDVAFWFSEMPEAYSDKPMGVKVSTLFRRKFIPPYFPYFNKPVQPLDVYAGVVTQGNIQKCHDFLLENMDTFQKAEKKYFVPKEILVSLLMVETRLGNFMGSERAFWSLACMASAEMPESIASYLERLPVTEEHEDWIGDILKARSDWAYTELKALILYSRLHEHDPLQITGSIYGAIGLCQFMPSNISFYAVDGNGDGRIDLFDLEDAVPSAANFLKSHGWKKDVNAQRKVRLLKYYNHSTAYANTIIKLADGVTAKSKAEAAAQKKASASQKAAPANKNDAASGKTGGSTPAKNTQGKKS